jgi:hypothetical protein
MIFNLAPVVQRLPPPPKPKMGIGGKKILMPGGEGGA